MTVSKMPPTGFFNHCLFTLTASEKSNYCTMQHPEIFLNPFLCSGPLSAMIPIVFCQKSHVLNLCHTSNKLVPLGI